MKKYYSIYAAAALLLTACTQDFLQNGEEARDSKVISFSAQTVSVQDDTRSASLPDALPLKGDGMELWLIPSEEDMVSDATRGTQINSVEALSNFGVSAYRHGAIPAEKTLNEYLTDNNLKPDFFYNLEATKITDTQKFKLTKDFFWPTDDDVLSFFAYAPYGDENVVLSEATQEGPQSIDFKVNTVVKEQADFITAQASTTSHLNTSATPSVELNFTHQLTGIRFVLGDQFLKGWVKSISLKGVYTEGTYTIGGGWTLNDKKKGNFTISYNLDKPVAGTPGEEVSASDEVFMMIPHTFAADDAATIEVVYNDKYTDYIVSCPLKGQTWKAGKTVTYAITSNSLTTLRIGQIQFATTPEGAPKRIWEAGDKIGMYVVGSDGKKLKHKNIPVTYDGANWSVDHTTSEGTIYKLPGESFYFYYPYSNVSNGQPTGYPEQCPELKATAPVFFEGVIDYSTIKTDQSSLDNFLSSDLQVGRAEDDGRASMIKATMLRQRGVAVLTLGTKLANKTKVFSNGSTTGTVTETGNVTATSVFASGGNKPYQNGTKYYYYTQPNVSTSFNSATTEKDAWHEALVFNLAAGATTTLTAYSDRAWWEYVNAVWQFSEVRAHTWNIPVNGTYTMECWGASGGTGMLIDYYQPQMNSCNISNIYGRGAYAKGSISLTTSSNGGKLYIYVGGKGESVVTSQTAQSGWDKNSDGKYWKHETAGGFNGGGIGTYSPSDDHSGGGGGATDIRLTRAHATNNNVWNDATSINSRIMVAAGGGGGNGINSPSVTSTNAGMHGGTPNITNAAMATWNGNWTVTVNQTTGYQKGIGQPGIHNTSHSPGGGGSGYMGGIYYAIGNHYGPASGGSSYISGYTGCTPISGYTFSSMSFVSGNSGSCPNTTLGGANRARTKEDGYCRITLSRW